MDAIIAGGSRDSFRNSAGRSGSIVGTQASTTAGEPGHRNERRARLARSTFANFSGGHRDRRVSTGHAARRGRARAEFDVSRTPLREALFQQLASAGIVEMQPRRGDGRGRGLAAPHGGDVRGDGRARGPCAGGSPRRMIPAEHARLIEAHHACERPRASRPDPDKYYYENERSTTSSTRGVTTASSSSRPRPCIDASGRIAAARNAGAGPHAHLTARARGRGAGDPGGDAELTAQRLRDHVVIWGQRFADLVASLAELRNGAFTLPAARRRPRSPRRTQEDRLAIVYTII